MYVVVSSPYKKGGCPGSACTGRGQTSLKKSQPNGAPLSRPRGLVYLRPKKTKEREREGLLSAPVWACTCSEPVWACTCSERCLSSMRPNSLWLWFCICMYIRTNTIRVCVNAVRSWGAGGLPGRDKPCHEEEGKKPKRT